MKKKRLLFYGGCHGSILASIFSRFAVSADQLLIHSILNYELIRNDTPFPIELLSEFDYLIYNPIINSANHRTDDLEKHAQNYDIKLVSYPWLQWNGYFVAPEHIKLYGLMWGYPKILELGKQCKDVDELAKNVETLFCPEEVFSSLNSSFERLWQYEQGIKISDFIQEEYRDRRLFNTPDHPTTFCYQYVANKIAEEIGVRLSANFQNLN